MTESLASFAFRAAGLTDIGRKRQSNQDAVILSPELGFFAVSDGMGGLSHGELAAGYVREAMPLLLQNALTNAGGSLTPEEAAEALRSMTVYLSDRLYEETNIESTVMGTTLAGVWLVGEKAVFVSLGDSRCYILPRRRRKLRQINEDMNVAGLLLREGVITREEAGTHPGRARLTGYVGMPAPAAPQVQLCELQRGDRLLLCTDGLYGLVPEEEIAALLRSSRSPERICKSLVDRANACGGRDNIAAVYVKL